MVTLNGPEYMTGSTGNEVSQIQAMLAFQGYLQDAPDGIYGPKTKDAVSRFQSDRGLAIDGIVGDNTWAALFNGAPSPVPAPAPTVTVLPKSTTVPSVIALPSGQTAKLLAGLSPVQMIVLGVAGLALASVGLKPSRGRKRSRRR